MDIMDIIKLVFAGLIVGLVAYYSRIPVLTDIGLFVASISLMGIIALYVLGVAKEKLRQKTPDEIEDDRQRRADAQASRDEEDHARRMARAAEEGRLEARGHYEDTRPDMGSMGFGGDMLSSEKKSRRDFGRRGF